MKISTLTLLTTLTLTPSLHAGFNIETIPLPAGIPPEIGGICFDPDGKLLVATRRSDIFKATPAADPKDFQWSLFASGFHNACGVVAPTNNSIIVTQMGEITQATDTDNDGTADSYTRLSAEIGLSGNYHETDAIYPDGKGGYFIAAGTASHNGPTFWKTQGEYSKIGRRGRNNSSVPWRGWVMHLTKDKDGKLTNLTPFASGFRQPNGIFLDSNNRLWSGDNQGDFRAVTPLYHVQKDHFYGHPSSLVWDPNFPKDNDPLDLSQDELDKMRTHATVLLPYPEINRSAGQPAEIPAEFGCFPGQLLVPDNNGTRITRIMLDNVKGKLQGSCTHFINDKNLKSGNHRLTWSPDNKYLYVGQTTRGWGMLAEGLQRISFDGKKINDIRAINLTKTGFRFTTTFPVKDLKDSKFTVKSFQYQDLHKYGGGKLNQKTLTISNLKLVKENTITLDIDQLQAGKVYEIKIEKLGSNKDQKITSQTYYYTANVIW